MKFRHEINDCDTILDLANSTLTPTKNDKVFIKETNLIYDYDHLSTLAHNGSTIIEQTGFTGRWIAIGADVSRADDVVLKITGGTNPYIQHFYGEPESNISANDDKRELLIQVNEKYIPFINELYSNGLNPKICLLREPINGGGRKPYYDRGKKWTHPTHQNQAITGQKQSSGAQNSQNGAIMNPIDTEWDAPTDKTHIQAFIHPTDWFRLSGSTFGNQVMPILFDDWHDNNKIRIRGRKTGYYHGRKKALRFKFCLEWTNPTNPTVRLRSQPTVETVVLRPLSGIFGINGQYPATTSEFNKWFYSWTLSVK